MDIKIYRAATLQQALAHVREELGPDAAVLHTRQVRQRGLRRWLPGARQVEVTASASVRVPSRLPSRMALAAESVAGAEPFIAAEPTNLEPPAAIAPAAVSAASRDEQNDQLHGQLNELRAMVDALCRKVQQTTCGELPPALFDLYTSLLDAEFSEETARDLIERVRGDAMPSDLADAGMATVHVERMIESEIQTSGPLVVEPGRRRLVALVGPTGVGKTTTIAKLAANFRLREKRRVGLITVDTYRIAAVEQLRTYADIIDLPMHVVSTPREMRSAVQQMADLDLILMDTAGRSPRDEVKLQELKAFLGEAQADDVLLVLSAMSGAATLSRTAERFAEVGTTGLIVTKLDEATGLGNLLPALRHSKLPLTYITDGQNVPDDIETADARRLVQRMFGRPLTFAHN